MAIVLLLNAFLDFSKTFVEGVLAMARNILINLGFVHVGILQAFGDAAALVFRLLLFAPPVRVDNPVDRVGAGALVTLRVLTLVRVLNLVALLAGRPLLVLSGNEALDRVGSSAPRGWRFSHNLGFNFLFW